MKDVLAVTDYGSSPFISAVQRGKVVGTQFHPEKSGWVGLKILRNFLQNNATQCRPVLGTISELKPDRVMAGAKAKLNKTVLNMTSVSYTLNYCGFSATSLAKRIVACLDVRSNDAGDLVVTKGYQYDVRESSSSDNKSEKSKGLVRNFGMPVVRQNHRNTDFFWSLDVCFFIPFFRVVNISNYFAKTYCLLITGRLWQKNIILMEQTK